MYFQFLLFLINPILIYVSDLIDLLIFNDMIVKKVNHLMDPNRIFVPEQIQVHPELPSILKDYSKAVLKANPKDILQFSFEYFQKLAIDDNQGGL